ncbi:TonB-dependent receptor [Marinifilum sp.]|uniref:TonB-dependent receptor n=1 Tax=Marinifilum sp. TaxID=2033137 RepID=UPI003BACFCCD
MPNKIIGGDITNSLGIAKLDIGSRKKVIVTAGFMGFQNVSQTVDVSSSTFIDIKLPPQAKSIDEITVIAKSKEQLIRESPEAVSVIGAKELQGRAVTIESFLNRNTGIKIRQTGGLGSSSRIMIHGLEGNRVKVLVNGTPIDMFDGMFSIDDIPINTIDRIEVYKSIIPARFGVDGLGGAINIVTKEFDTDYFDLSYEIGSFNTHKVSNMFRKNLPEKGMLIGGGGFYNYSLNNYDFHVPKREHLKVEQDHAKFESYMLKGVVKFTKLWFDQISLELGYYNRFSQMQGVTDNIQHAHTKQQMYSIENKFEKEGFISRKLNFTMHNNFGHTCNNFIDTSAYRYDFEGNRWLSQSIYGETGDVPHNSNDKGVSLNSRINLDFLASRNHSINLNSAFSYSKRNPQDELANQYANYAISGYPNKLTSLISSLTWEAKFASKKIINMLSAKHFYINTKVEELGSHVQQNTSTVKQNTSNNIGFVEAIKWQFIPDFHLKASYQRAIRLPATNELFGDGVLIIPAANLKPEQSHNVNFGLLTDKSGVLCTKRLQFETGLFYMNIKDMIAFVEQYRVAGYANIEQVEIKGVEAELKLDINKHFYTYANITYQDARNILKYDPISNSPNPKYGLRMPNMPYLFSNFGLEYHNGELFNENWFIKLFWDGRFTEKYYYSWKLSSNQSRTIPSCFINDIGVSAELKKRFTISAECHNIHNSEEWNLYQTPLPGRSFHVKLRYTFLKSRDYQ